MKKILFTSLLFISGILSAQTEPNYNALKGRIINENNHGIPYANIEVRGGAERTTTDTAGRFSFEVDKNVPYSILITAAGYIALEFRVRSRDVNNVLIQLQSQYLTDTIIVSSRRRREVLQDVPIPISVVTAGLLSDAGAFNVNRVKELIPSVNLYSSNPRNTALNIRGQGTTFGLTNDGVEPGVGFYVDGVYYARPAATTLDFIDVERIEVLRGPQGTLFGKNTTAGAFNITTRRPSFKPGGNFEVSYGNYGFLQAKAFVTGSITKKIAGRVSFSGTQRDGLIYNRATQKYTNDMNNLGVRGQLLFQPTENVDILLSADATKQRPDGFAQVVAGVVKTQRADYRQFENIIADLNYQLPTRNPFDRVIDHNTPWRSGNELGGTALNVDFKLSRGTITSTTAWRYWNWDPSNDRDFTGLPVLTLSQATSKHKQWSQEVRYAGDLLSNFTGVFGAFVMGQDLKTDPEHIEESGAAQWRFSQSSTSNLWQTPGLFEGYGIKTRSRLQTFNGAVFGQIDWAITPRLHLLPGIRFNYDSKKVNFDRKTYGGLQTDDPALLALKRAVYTDQAFNTNTANNNISSHITLNYKATNTINSYITYSTNYKSVGLNLGGLPTVNGQPMTELATIKPEYVKHFEAGIKTTPVPGATLNLTLYNTSIRDFQTQVQTAEVGVNRGYLANAEKVRISGAEIDANIRFGSSLNAYGALAYTDGKYVKFINAPVPLEETGGAAAFKDISGGRLPGVSKWTGSLGGEVATQGRFLGNIGNYFIATDGYYRSGFSSSASPSAYLNIDGYTLLNARAGFKATRGISTFFWIRNVLDKNYFEQLLPAAGNAGHYAAVLGDPRTYGITLRFIL